MRTSDIQATTSTITAPSLDAQRAFEIVPRITRHDLEAMSARRAGKAPVPPDPLDIGLWSPMRQQLAFVLRYEGVFDLDALEEVATRALVVHILRRLACRRARRKHRRRAAVRAEAERRRYGILSGD